MITHLDFRPDEAEEQRLQNDPEIGQVGRHGVVLGPALPPPAQASREGHHENGLGDCWGGFGFLGQFIFVTFPICGLNSDVVC